MMKKYLLVTKPGIIFGNMVSVIGGFLLAAQGNVDAFLMFATVVGVSLVVASGCVFNNYIDRDIDCLMERTKNRVLVQGLISPKITLIYATALGALGFALLYVFTNPQAVGFALLGFVVYVGVYSLYMKRKSVYGTLVGSLSGAAPPVIGYCAVSGQFDTGAMLLLVIFSLWQMPHFTPSRFFAIRTIWQRISRFCRSSAAFRSRKTTSLSTLSALLRQR